MNFDLLFIILLFLDNSYNNEHFNKYNILDLDHNWLKTSSTDGNLVQKRTPFYEKDFGGLFTYDQKKIIFIAIIDIFTAYGLVAFFFIFNFNSLILS